MPPKPKRRRLECILCQKTYDSDYRRSHNEKHHPERVTKHQHIPFKDVGAPNNPFHQAARALSTPKVRDDNQREKICDKVQSGVCLSSFKSLKDLPSPSSDVISTDSTEPLEFMLSTQNQSQEARKLTDLSIEQPIPANEESVSAETSPLLEKNAADENEGGAELSSEKKGNALMTDLGLFDLDNMDDTLQKRLIINGCKSAEISRHAKEKHSQSPSTVPIFGLSAITASVRAETRKRKANTTNKSKEKVHVKSGRGSAVSFLSAESQNKLIGIIGSHIQQTIVNEIKSAGNYSIAMDCTTDSSHDDQLSVIIRYVNEKCNIVERLLCIERVKESSAKGLVTIGASVMRGKYNGVKARIQKESPQCLFIWTFDHVLNLVIMEAC
eukprot:gene13142-14493_t